jgi:2-polyprenyl-3-methyl-5-hydroxy-6-metoxy-1,4-benzoquinol methylase
MIQAIELKNKILKDYRSRSYAEKFQNKFLKLKEKLMGVDRSIFIDTIEFYEQIKGLHYSYDEALAKALNKREHKESWYRKSRKNESDFREFYKEVNIYPFRQPYLWRYKNVEWYINLISDIDQPKILEYGCGSACLTEKLIKKYPSFNYTIADIPSVTLEFVRWKKEKYNYKYKILEIGPGREGIPLSENYNLIVCTDVLEHTLNPLDIVKSFVHHLEYKGALVVDFILDPGGENLEVAANERPYVVNYLNEQLIAVKKIDEYDNDYGIYVKD